MTNFEKWLKTQTFSVEDFIRPSRGGWGDEFTLGCSNNGECPCYWECRKQKPTYCGEFFRKWANAEAKEDENGDQL